MARAKSEDERIGELEFEVPELWKEVETLKAALRGQGEDGEEGEPVVAEDPPNAAIAAGWPAFNPALFRAWPFWWFPPLPLNEAGGDAGLVVDEAKIRVDQLLLDIDDVENRDSDVTDFAGQVDELLEKARGAQSKVRKAATAGHVHRRVRADLRKARNSFNEADKLIRESRTGGSAVSRKRKLKRALDKINDDLGHLQDALDKI